MSVAFRRLLESPLLEPALLLAAARRSSALSDETRRRLAPWARAARSRYRVALELRDENARPAALSLLREAAFFALCGVAVAEGEEAPRSVSAAWARVAATPAFADAPEALAVVQAPFSSEQPLALDELEPAHATEVRSAAETAVEWLLSLLEERSPRELRRARLVRSFLALVGCAVVLVALVSYWQMLSELGARG